MAGPPGHIHVSERQAGAWDDCEFCSALMLARAVGVRAPATLAEAKLLRAAGGAPPTGGGTTTQARVGIAKRYHRTDFTVHPNTSPAAVWAALPVGFAAAAQGSMGAFPVGSHWRRWDPRFAGSHCAFVARMDNTDRVWWDDPLAPTGTYVGEWMTKADFLRFVGAMAVGSALVGQFAGNVNPPNQGGTVVQAPITEERPATFDVDLGTPFYDLDGKTQVGKSHGAYPGRYSPYGTATMRAMYATMTDGLRRTVLAPNKNVKIIVDTTPFSQAQLDAAANTAKAEGTKAGIEAEKADIRSRLGV